MPDHIYFPTHIGLLQKEHRDRIGPAVWEFLWCISKTTKEEVEDGETLGIVLGGKPISYNEVAKELGGSKSTVKRNFERLEEHEYIYLKRTPYGHLIRVRNSKKFIQKKNKSTNNSTRAKNDTGAINEQGGAKNDYPRAKNGHSNKDKEVDKEVDKNATTTTGTRASEFSSEDGTPETEKKEVSLDGITNYQRDLINHFLQQKGAMVHQSKDEEAAKEIESNGVPLASAKQYVTETFEEYKQNRTHSRQKINSLEYCVGPVLDKNYVAQGSDSKSHTKKARRTSSQNNKSNRYANAF